MKIWIDITNSPHINFFKPFITVWKANGHEISITCRNLSNTIELVQLNGWQYKEVGGHVGGNAIKKLIYFPKRVFKLWKFLKIIKPDVGISHSSFYAPLASKLAGIPSVYLNDNEHALGNYLAFYFATRILLPESLRKLANKKRWINIFNIDFYPGVKEGIYLSQSHFKSNGNNGLNKKVKIYIRPEPWTAQYYNGQKFFLDDVLSQATEVYQMIILPRDKNQADYYKTKSYSHVNVLEKPMLLKAIVSDCDLFIGAGGSMTREICILGIPTISIYQDKLLEVDKFLISKGMLHHTKKVDLNYIKEIIASHKTNSENTLMKKGDNAFNKVNETLNNLNKHAND